MKALKVTVAVLAVIVAGLLLVIHRLTTLERPEVATVTAAAPAAVIPSAPISPVDVNPQAEKQSPIHKRVLRARSEAPGEQRVSAAAREQSRQQEQESDPQPVASAPNVTAAAPAPTAPAPDAARRDVPEAPRRVTIPAGTAIVIRTQNTLSTARSRNGDTFRATLDEPLSVNGLVIAEKGADVDGTIVRSQQAGRVEGVSELGVELVRLASSDGQRIPITTDSHSTQGERSRRRDAEKVGAATGIGAIIGAIAGGGKGAALGAGVGAGAGGGAVLATRGKDAEIPSESRIVFHTRTAVEVTERE